jgi:hypothetical protein
VGEVVGGVNTWEERKTLSDCFCARAGPSETAKSLEGLQSHWLEEPKARVWDKQSLFPEEQILRKGTSNSLVNLWLAAELSSQGSDFRHPSQANTTGGHIRNRGMWSNPLVLIEENDIDILQMIQGL